MSEPVNEGLQYGGHPVFSIGREYYYVASKHKTKGTADSALSRLGNRSAKVRKFAHWYLVLVKLPKDAQARARSMLAH